MTIALTTEELHDVREALEAWIDSNDDKTLANIGLEQSEQDELRTQRTRMTFLLARLA